MKPEEVRINILKGVNGRITYRIRDINNSRVNIVLGTDVPEKIQKLFKDTQFVFVEATWYLGKWTLTSTITKGEGWDV